MAEDIRVKLGFFRHPKTRKLRRLVGGDGAFAFLELWAFCAGTDGRETGDLNGMDDDDIELAADWRGENGMLVDALSRVGYLDGEEMGRSIHDFTMHQPFASSRPVRVAAARKANMVRWHRAGRHSDPYPDCPLCESEPTASEPEEETSEPDEELSDPESPIPSPPPPPSRNTNPIPTAAGNRVASVAVSSPGATHTLGVKSVFDAWNEECTKRGRADLVVLQPHSGLKAWCEAERRMSQDGIPAETVAAAARGIWLDDWEGRANNLSLFNAVKSLEAVQRHAAAANGKGDGGIPDGHYRDEHGVLRKFPTYA